MSRLTEPNLFARLALAAALCLCSATISAQSTSATAPAAPSAPAPPAAEPAPQLNSSEHPDTETTADIKLPGVKVQGKRNVFDENDKKLKQLKDSLPCAGCDAKPHTKKKFVKKVLDAVGERVLPTEAPDHSDRDANDKAEEFSRQNTCTAANVGGCVSDNAKP